MRDSWIWVRTGSGISWVASISSATAAMAGPIRRACASGSALTGRTAISVIESLALAWRRLGLPAATLSIVSPGNGRGFARRGYVQIAFSSRLVSLAGLRPQELAFDLAGQRSQSLDDARHLHRSGEGAGSVLLR